MLHGYLIIKKNIYFLLFMYLKILAKSVRFFVAIQIGGFTEKIVNNVCIKLSLKLSTGLNHLKPTPIESFMLVTWCHQDGGLNNTSPAFNSHSQV
jgi:hypothetical protein